MKFRILGFKDYVISFCDIELHIRNTFINNGTTTLMLQSNDQPSIQLRAENGIGIVMLGEMENDEWEVRTLRDINKRGTMISILGDTWGSGTCTEDIDLVIKVFKEFYETGTVSKELMT